MDLGLKPLGLSPELIMLASTALHPGVCWSDARGLGRAVRVLAAGSSDLTAGGVFTPWKLADATR